MLSSLFRCTGLFLAAASFFVAASLLSGGGIQKFLEQPKSDPAIRDDQFLNTAKKQQLLAQHCTRHDDICATRRHSWEGEAFFDSQLTEADY